jgi:DNA-binding LacI/PurR family transcriptional regulator
MARRLLDEHPDLTGVVVHNEALIEPLIRAFDLQGGRRVPEDLSVVAIGSSGAVRGVTSVAIPAEEIGQSAVQLLMAQLRSDEPRHTVLTLITPQLNVHTTTARPKR